MTRKAMSAFLVGISVVSLIAAISDSPTVPPKSMADIPGAAELIQQMPNSSSYTYSTNEFMVLNDMVAKGMVLRHYRRTFANLESEYRNIREKYKDLGNNTEYDEYIRQSLTKHQAKLRGIYKDFGKDMEQYDVYLRQSLLKLNSYTPSGVIGEKSQVAALIRGESLSWCVSDYKSHMSTAKDTLEYLDDCIYALERASQQTNLPR